jgi:hypothetical protein
VEAENNFCLFVFVPPERTSTLAHVARLCVVRTLLNREGRFSDLVASLRLPHTLSQYLMFPELAPHSHVLGQMKRYVVKHATPEPEPLSPDLDVDE